VGLLDFFRRRRARESALAEAQATPSAGGFSVESAPSSGAQLAGSEGQAGQAGIAEMHGALQQPGQVQVSHTEQTLDLRNIEGLREDVLNALRQHGIDPDSQETIDASTVPGLEEAVMRAFQAHGMDIASLTALAGGSAQMVSGAGAAAPEGADDVAIRLSQLDDLRAQGLLSEEEYRSQRERILCGL
jgi:hypothetical protein